MGKAIDGGCFDVAGGVMLGGMEITADTQRVIDGIHALADAVDVVPPEALTDALLVMSVNGNDQEHPAQEDWVEASCQQSYDALFRLLLLSMTHSRHLRLRSARRAGCDGRQRACGLTGAGRRKGRSPSVPAEGDLLE